MRVAFLLVIAVAGTTATGFCGEIRFRNHADRFPAPRETIVLDGEWDYRHPKHWQKPDALTAWRKVMTPYCADSRLAPTRLKQTYRRKVVIPALEGRRAILHFECMPEVCETSLNGTLVDAHGHGGVPYELDVTPFVRTGENEIELTVRPVAKAETVPEGGVWYKEPPYITGHQMGYSHSVVLELRPSVSVEDVTIVSHVDGGNRLQVTAEVTNATAVARTVTVTGKVGSFAVGARTLTLAPQAGVRIALEQAWPEAKMWTPDTPNLYHLDLTVSESGRTVDARRERFGFREIRWKKDKVFLNGVPFMLRRTCASVNSATNESQIVEAVRRMKRRGLNGNRVEPMNVVNWLDVADEEGFFMSPMTMTYKAKSMHPAAWEEWRAMNVAFVKAHKNHPCIIAWGVGGEMGSYYGLTADPETNKALTAELQKSGLAVAAADPTRPWAMHGDNEVSYPCHTRGPATVRTWHYPNPPTVDKICYPEGAWWFKQGVLSYHGMADRDKPTCFGEDFYHGFHDQFFGLTKWAGDRIWTLDGYLEAWRDAVWMAADGFYDAELAGWNLWIVHEEAVTNRLTDAVCGGQLMPDYLISLREPFRNLRSGQPETRTLTVYNKRFLDRDIRLVREIFPRDAVTSHVSQRAVGRDEWTFTVAAGGRHVQAVDVPAPETGKRPQGFTHRYAAYDARTGEKLFAREWLYTVFPVRRFRWPEAVTVVSNGVSGVTAAIASGKPIVVMRSLSGNEGRELKAHVVRGGRVMIVDAKGGWLPLQLLGDKKQSFVFRRSATAMPEISEDMLACWRTNTYVGTSGYVKSSDRTLQVLFDSGHAEGLNEVQVGRLWDAKGHWFLCQLPLLGEPRDAAAEWVLASAVKEFLSGGPALGKTLALAADDPMASAWRNDGVLFGPAADAKPETAVLGVSLQGADAAARWAEAKAFAAKGGTVFVHSVTMANAGLLADVGISARSLSSSVYVTRKMQGGLMEGLSNNDLYFSVEKLGNVKFSFENTMALNRVKKFPDELLTCALEGAGVVTEPGALADVAVGSGRIVVSTLRWDKEALLHPKTARFLLRGLLRNVGVNAASETPDTVEQPVNLSKYVNRPLWNDPRTKGAKAWFGGDDDMRYFPVNLCGWSRDSGNCCPVETVPMEPIRYLGIPFKISHQTFGREQVPAAIVLEPGEKVRVETWLEHVKTFRFLGAMEKFTYKCTPNCDGKTVLKLRHGYRNECSFEEDVVAGDHVNGYRWGAKVLRGAVGWTGYSKDETNAALYVWSMPSSSTKPRGGVTTFVELENIGSTSIAIVGLTVERK